MKDLFKNNRRQIYSWILGGLLIGFGIRALDLYDAPEPNSDGLLYNWRFNALMGLAAFVLLMVLWYLAWKKNPGKWV